MGVGRIGRTRVRPGSLENDAEAYRRFQMPEQANRRTATMKAVGLILVAVIAVGFVVGWMRTSLFGPQHTVNILVVEDQTVTRELMISVAHAAFPGATVRAAADLASALSSARNMARLDMVLLDLGLPDGQGLDGLLCFRADFPQAKIVIVSSQDTPELIADAMDLGASGLMPVRSSRHHRIGVSLEHADCPIVMLVYSFSLCSTVRPS
jgi:CheY-like chemotaxis protein